ncbi:hypothetical protein [Vibrio coralliilyticus]|uniref:hypothetical protein n=1 Tax=Vibrio coralliilyticus TaxID=190893 RepID=UPI002409BF15|nr:hypothetical protein [Vibrio coralliilyticus]WFB46728.1 hypothetical protein P6988_11365 [Vibrio coralliilyticus]
MQVINPFFNTQTTISDVDQLADRLLALSDKDTQLISDVLSLAQEDASLLSKLNQHTTVIDQQAALITQLKTDVSHAQALASASRENLLINPRGKINQANESDGVLAAGVYFCDGWKAGENGAEVYRDADGFRLVNGSIVQLVPNNVEPNQTLRGNLTAFSGTPKIKINSGADSAQSDSAEYIQFEVSGNDSKFTKLVLAESEELPMYRQQANELTQCLDFLRYQSLGSFSLYSTKPNSGNGHLNYLFDPMHKKPAVVVGSLGANTNLYALENGRVSWACSAYHAQVSGFIMLDARP